MATHFHLGRKANYDAIDTLRLQFSTPPKDGDQFILYRSEEDGQLWARSPSEFFDSSRFKPLPVPMVIPGSNVLKAVGYPFPGEVRSVFWTRANQRRFVVEATGRDYAGMLHIFNGTQLTNLDGTPLERKE